MVVPWILLMLDILLTVGQQDLLHADTIMFFTSLMGETGVKDMVLHSGKEEMKDHKPLNQKTVKVGDKASATFGENKLMLNATLV